MLTQKLIQKGLINKYQKDTSKKEIYFELTHKGEQIFQKHEQLHEEFLRRDREVLELLPDEVADEVMKFTNAYNEHLNRIMVEMKQ